MVNASLYEWTIADRLRKAREATGLDQTEFAKLIGVSRGTVSNYERGVDSYKRPVLLAWAADTGVTVDWFMTGLEPHSSAEQSNLAHRTQQDFGLVADKQDGEVGVENDEGFVGA